MAFLFKSKKNQNSALPTATREITSSHGTDSATAPGQNGTGTIKDKGRGPALGLEGVNNNSVSSLEARNTTSPEPRLVRERNGSDPANVSNTSAE